jgi:hypothetical protein
MRSCSVAPSASQTVREHVYHAIVVVLSPASTYDADTIAFVVAVARPTVCTAGGTHEPFSAASCGQY